MFEMSEAVFRYISGLGFLLVGYALGEVMAHKFVFKPNREVAVEAPSSDDCRSEMVSRKELPVSYDVDVSAKRDEKQAVA